MVIVVMEANEHIQNRVGSARKTQRPDLIEPEIAPRRGDDQRRGQEGDQPEGPAKMS
jgi:hypothetical protein